MPNIRKMDSAWYDVYAESAITAGTAITIQNQSAGVAWLRQNSTDIGYMLRSGQEVDVTGTTILQAKCDSNLSLFVQVMQ